MSNLAFAISAQIGSGKTTLSVELAKTLNYKYVSFGNYVRKAAIKMGYADATRNELQMIGETLFNEGVRSFCQSVLKDSMWDVGEGLVIDGVRHLEIWETIKDIIRPQNAYLIFITLDEEARIKRLMDRGPQETADSVTKHSTEAQVPEILKLKADFIVDGSELSSSNVQKILEWLKN